MFREIAHRLPALLNAERYSAAEPSERGARVEHNFPRLLGAAAHQWLTLEMRREEIRNN
jgi:hypothetical protein